MAVGTYLRRMAGASSERAPWEGAGELFNLRQDPPEEHHLAAEHPAVAQRLRELLESLVGARQ